MKVEAFELISRNIATHGHHVYLVTQSASPRYAYTIGLTEGRGVEVVLAGGALYTRNDVHLVINEIADALREGAPVEGTFRVGLLGSFRLATMTDAWMRRLMLGATDYYRERSSSLKALQILPDTAHATIDIPDLAGPFELARNQPWRWIDEPWTYSVPEHSVAMADRAVLCGSAATYVARWEEDQWEVFSTPPADVDPATCRPVPINVLVAADPGLSVMVDLAVGTRAFRKTPFDHFRSE